MFKSDNFVFCREEDANYILEAMKSVLNAYGSVTIADAYDLIDFYKEPFLNGNEMEVNKMIFDVYYKRHPSDVYDLRRFYSTYSPDGMI